MRVSGKAILPRRRAIPTDAAAANEPCTHGRSGLRHLLTKRVQPIRFEHIENQGDPSHVSAIETFVRPQARPFCDALLKSPAPQRKAALRRRPLLEDLEGRQMLSTLYVTTADDNGSNTNPLAGSLRAAIIAADAAPAGTYSTIDFKIQGSGLQQISLASVLPPITNPVNIDGLSQSGSTRHQPTDSARRLQRGHGRFRPRLSAVGLRHRVQSQSGQWPGDHRLQRRRRGSERSLLREPH